MLTYVDICCIICKLSLISDKRNRITTEVSLMDFVVIAYIKTAEKIDYDLSSVSDERKKLIKKIKKMLTNTNECAKISWLSKNSKTEMTKIRRILFR